MRVAYITYNERPGSGLLRTQVISLLKEMKSQNPGIRLTLISFWQPWVHYANRRRLAAFKEELSAAGMEFEAYPYALPSRYFLYKSMLVPIARRYAIGLLKSTLRNRFDLVHARGYIASAAAAALKPVLGFRCIFDMRSLFPEEHLSIGTWTRQDKAFRTWKAIEKETIAASDATVGVSPRMVDEIAARVPGANAVHIPCCADTGTLRFDMDARTAHRKKHGWEDRLVVAYAGSLGTSSWNNVDNYARYYSMIRKACRDAFLVLLTPNHDIDYSKIFGRYGIEGDQFLRGETSPADLYKWLSAADVGLQVMSSGADSHTRLGVKFVEYLSCGLPVVINSNVGGACHYVTQYPVGAIIDIEDEKQAEEQFLRFREKLCGMRENCRRVAETHFSQKRCAEQYLRVYAQVMEQA